MKRNQWQYVAFAIALVLCSALSYRFGNSIVTVNEVSYLTPHYLGEPETESQINPAVDQDDSQSLIFESGLEAFESVEKNKSAHAISEMQVMKRAEALGISEETVGKSEIAWKTIYADVHSITDHLAEDRENLEFAGTTARELNVFLSSTPSGNVSITSDLIILDETIAVPSSINLKGSNTILVPQEGAEIDKAILLDNVENVSVSGLSIQGNCKTGVFVTGCRAIDISDNTIVGMAERGIAFISDNEASIIKSNVISDCKQGGILLDGNISSVVLEDNSVSCSKNEDNLMAGIVISAVEIEDSYRTYNTPHDSHIYDLLNAPHDVVLINNESANNYAQGVYVYGGYRDYFVGNKLHGNDLEGICLDFGAMGCYLSNNVIENNSDRAHVGNENTWFLKVPGISLDNAAYNLITHNRVEGNSGSGIKAVRSSVRNYIIENDIIDNNAGMSDKGHFFGVELATDTVPDIEGVEGIDFLPCQENLIINNNIVGSHFSGIFLGVESTNNYCSNNKMTGMIAWGIECMDEAYNLNIFSGNDSGESENRM